ncbi:polypyrimidine tract-binding protein 1-like isoform X2 [Tachypleus tridentatus]|uniref:polypyrimidine tract-binding protein 1-like isoform X2 n=1 Tax=Tachypleus tridentatus TaxID=6853 RepID=UPI003FD24697
MSAVVRGADDVLPKGAVSNGTVRSVQVHPTDNNNDAKKAKVEKSQPDSSSRVLHVRNIPNEATEMDVIHLGIPFGRVTNVLLLKGKNQAFLEMMEPTAVTTMVNYYNSSGAPLIRGRTVYVQFSNHKELKTDSTHSNAHASTQAALQVAQTLAYQAETQGGPNTVLRVVVDNQIYPVTLDILYQIFSRVGKVLKIVTFTKNNTFQALIQYPDIITTQAAKLTLNGQNIYNACCTLRIEYSKLTNLNVKYNNEKSRDFTNPTLMTGDPTLDALGIAGSMTSPFNPASGLASPLTATYGAIPFGGFALPPTVTSPSVLGLSRIRLPGHPVVGCVLLSSNLNEQMVTPEALFILFGVYGDVVRVKILFNKKDNALIQMAEPQQAQLAMTHLDKISLYGKQMRITPSKHQIVQMPKEGQPDAGLTKDFATSPLHRFKKPGSKNYQNIYPPTSTLHLSNIPPDISEDEIKDAFTQTGGVVTAFKFFPKDPKMALIQMGSVEEAVIALIKMHNYQLSDSNHLRVSFSKTAI